MTQLFAARDIPTADEVNSLMVNRYVKMTPASVQGTGVTISSAGDVVFSNVTATSINGCFTADFRVYEIHYDTIGTAASLLFRLRAAGTNSATNYDFTNILGANGAISSATALNQAQWDISPATNTRHAGSFRVYAPFLTTTTAITGLSGVHANPAVSNTSNGVEQYFGTHRLTTSYDGFGFNFSAAQTGTLSIFGLY